METSARGASMGNGARRVSESKPWAAGEVGIPQIRSETMGHRTEEFKGLGRAHALGARGSVSRSGVPLGLDRTSDGTRGWAHRAPLLVRTHRGCGAGSGCPGVSEQAKELYGP